jgi:hypothetical protein
MSESIANRLERVISSLRQAGHDTRIRAWRQEIDDEDAATEGRPAETATTDKAVQYFRDALFYENHRHHGAARDLLHELKASAILRVSALQNPERRPPFLSSAEHAYCERFDRAEDEAAKWDIPLAEERRLNWGQLAKEKRWDELAADQAELFESWLIANPERVNELLPRFVNSGDRPDGTMLPDEAYHSSGLFWLAANVLFKMYGFDDRIAEPMIKRLEAKFAKFRRPNPDVVTAGVGSGYAETIHQFADKGAHVIHQIDHYLLTAVRSSILRENGFDGHRQEEQPVLCPQCGTSEIIPPAECPNCHCGIPEQPRIVQRQEQSIDDPDTEESLPASQTTWPDAHLRLSAFINSVPERYRRYLSFVATNPDATDEEVATELSCSTRTIERYRKELDALLKR